LAQACGYEGERPALTGPRCASVHGFSLHANTQVPAHRQDQLERLIRYTARGAVALARLEEDVQGDLVYTFTKPWSDGTTGITLSPLELLEKLAALVPLPRVHLVRYGGCLAAHSRLRAAWLQAAPAGWGGSPAPGVRRGRRRGMLGRPRGGAKSALNFLSAHWVQAGVELACLPWIQQVRAWAASLPEARG
jgi:hypothetical protein